jgi:hypothetical protein
MNSRLFISGLLTIGCAALLWGAAQRREQLAGLRARQQQLLAQLALPASETAGAPTPAAAAPSAASPSVSPELLQLRAEVTQLTKQKRALAAVMAENERLRAEFAARTNAAPPAPRGP